MHQAVGAVALPVSRVGLLIRISLQESRLVVLALGLSERQKFVMLRSRTGTRVALVGLRVAAVQLGLRLVHASEVGRGALQVDGVELAERLELASFAQQVRLVRDALQRVPHVELRRLGESLLHRFHMALPLARMRRTQVRRHVLSFRLRFLSACPSKLLGWTRAVFPVEALLQTGVRDGVDAGVLDLVDQVVGLAVHEQLVGLLMQALHAVGIVLKYLLLQHLDLSVS